MSVGSVSERAWPSSEMLRRGPRCDLDGPRNLHHKYCENHGRQDLETSLRQMVRTVSGRTRKSPGRWTPILQHTHQLCTRDVGGDTILRDPGEAGALRETQLEL
jgi:hypothetical protein